VSDTFDSTGSPHTAKFSPREIGCYVLPVVTCDSHVPGTESRADSTARHVALQQLSANVSHVIEYHRQRDISFMDVFYQGSLHPVT
jgi:hypothetical protein